MTNPDPLCPAGCGHPVSLHTDAYLSISDTEGYDMKTCVAAVGESLIPCWCLKTVEVWAKLMVEQGAQEGLFG